ncbi:MAG TPA: hypothetical protein VGE09_06415 [Pseudoxanthomonas sp.]
MGRGTLGNPRIRESRGTKQARQIRALQDRVRRLEKLVRPSVCYAGPIDLSDFLSVKAQAGETMSLTHHAAMTSGRVLAVSDLYPQPRWYVRAARALHRFLSVGFPGRRSGAWPRWAGGQGKPSLSDDTQ